MKAGRGRGRAGAGAAMSWVARFVALLLAMPFVARPASAAGAEPRRAATRPTTAPANLVASPRAGAESAAEARESSASGPATTGATPAKPPAGPYENMAIGHRSAGDDRTGDDRAGDGTTPGGGAEGISRDPNLNSTGLGKVGLALAGVLGLVFALTWLWRRLSGQAESAARRGAIRVVYRTPLSPKQQLALIHIGKRLVLVAHNGLQASPLCEINDPDEVAALIGRAHGDGADADGTATGSFGPLLGQARRQYGTASGAGEGAEGIEGGEGGETPTGPAGGSNGDGEEGAATPPLPGAAPADGGRGETVEEAGKDLDGLREKIRRIHQLSEQLRRP